jgi:hypothetical protein
MKSLGSFSITANESRDFARGSGDFNPLHLDPVAARRTRFGQTLIHGVCGTIRALDLLLQDTQTKTTLLSIKVKYSKPVSQGQGQELTVFGATREGMTRLEIFAGGVRCQIIDLELVEGTAQAYGFDPQRLADCSDNAGPCTDLAIDDCEGLSGAVDLLWDNDAMQALFPTAANLLPREQLATLMASTQIVGMKCPGLHSVFAKLDLRFPAASAAAGAASAQLEYRVLNIDKRIDRVVLGIGNTYAQGTVEAFFRPPPAHQASFQRITSLVTDAEFRQQNALVVGGSRGLGEVITKVLAAGGANVRLRCGPQAAQ